MIGYVIGGLIRLNRDYTSFGAPLEKGAVVTIKSLSVETVDGKPEPVAIVTPGDYKVILAHATPVATHDLIHPETLEIDAEEQESFEEIVDLDPMLRALTAEFADKSIEDIVAALGGDVDIPDTLPPSAPVDGTVGLLEREQEYEPTPDDTVRYTDLDGDVMEVGYREQTCETHGIEAFLYFQINDHEAAVVPVEALPGLMQWIATRAQKYVESKKAEKEQDGK